MPRIIKKFMFVFLISVCLLPQSQQAIASGYLDNNNATLSNSESDIIRFAVIGDYGKSGQPEADVATLVKSWSPDFIITTGDNNYHSGEAATIDANIGQYYRQYIYPYLGSYGVGGTTNNFYPSLGNHDWVTEINQLPQPYLNYFSLPGNERYYDFTRGAVHFYVVDSDSSEPDGISSNSVQGQWLQAALAASTEVWNIVYFHHSPYSSSSHGSNITLQWPFQAWGADIVLTGHDHTYERLLVNNFPYIVNGLGGYPTIYSFNTPVSGSLVRYNSDYGAIHAEATSEYINFKFITRNGDVIDSYTLGTPPTIVNAIQRVQPTPSSATNVDFSVTFSESVQNVDVNDFSLTTTGITGASITGVTPVSASVYTVSVNTGSGSGTLRLDVPVSATIQDLNSNDLGGLPFTSGETYTKVVSVTYKSGAANDGWILEASETSNIGGSLNSSATNLILGDDATDKQYRAILHFDTSSLPDNAVVTAMTLKVKQQGNVVGTNPFSFGSLYVDMRNPAFGNSILELVDFNFAAKKVKSAVFNPNAVSGWFSARFNTGGKLYVNRTGVSQLRLYFSVDDNNNNIADFIRFYSGNASAGDRPKLLITYYVP